MNEELANFYFPSTPEDDLFDLWEERFFEQKQFFLTHPPLRVVWESKLRRLAKAHTGFLVLTGQDEEVIESSDEIKTEEYSNDVLEAFNQFHVERNGYKTKVLQANTMQSLHTAVTNWLDFEKRFAELWYLPESESNELQVLRSKEPDPMYFLEDIKKVKDEMGIHTFEELKSNYNNLPESLQKEVKRLTLLTKK